MRQKMGLNTLFLLVNVQFVLGVFTSDLSSTSFTWRVTSIWSSFIVALSIVYLMKSDKITFLI